MPNSNKKPKASILDKMAGYAKNVTKEVKDFQKASRTREMYSYKGESYPPNDKADMGKGREYYAAKANAARKTQDAQQGQLLGAILQGRRYDKAGNQIKSTSKKKK